jgi:segregation and condensation protein B
LDQYDMTNEDQEMEEPPEASIDEAEDLEASGEQIGTGVDFDGLEQELLESDAGDETDDVDEPDSEAAEPDTSAPEPETEADPLTRDIEAILFISPDPVSLDVLAEVTGVDGDELSHAVETVRDKFTGPGNGFVFVELAGGYTFRTNDLALPSVERFCQRPADYSLTAAAMETLAIIAYLQPITRPEIARIRGISADTVVANLLEKGLLEESGRSRESGAVKYRTTRVFEKLFGLAGKEDLPAVEGFDATPQDVEELRQKLHLAADKRQ